MVSLQMANDFQIRAYSDYDSLEQAIEEVILSLQRMHQKIWV